MRFLITFSIGLIFGMGIILGGMANPAKVLNFFDVAGTWDPSLIFVMGGALVTAAIGYRIVFKRPTPRLSDVFHVPTSRVLDSKLVAGSAAFGIGWGIAGFCPGGVLPAIGTLNPSVLIFTASMIAGIFIAKALQARVSVQKASA